MEGERGFASSALGSSIFSLPEIFLPTTGTSLLHNRWNKSQITFEGTWARANFDHVLCLGRCIHVRNPPDAILRGMDEWGPFLDSFVSCCGDGLICAAVVDSMFWDCIAVFFAPELGFPLHTVAGFRTQCRMVVSLVWRIKEIVGLSPPAVTITDDVESTVTLGSGVSFCFCF